jgi:hypothetical protein
MRSLCEKSDIARRRGSRTSAWLEIVARQRLSDTAALLYPPLNKPLDISGEVLQ